MTNVFACTTTGCKGWCEFEDGRRTFDCPICGQTNCMQCRDIHSGIDCSTFQTLLEAKEFSKIQELKEKERKSGWCQLSASISCAGVRTVMHTIQHNHSQRCNINSQTS